MAAISLRQVSRSFAGSPAVNALTLDLPAGAYGVLVGPSGCGKTTTLRLIAGLESPDAGDIAIGDRNVRNLPPSERRVAMVFQSDSLYPHLSARHNLAFPLKARRVNRTEIDQRVSSIAAQLGLADHLDRRPAELSAGQQQRVALGRALVVEPAVLLLDEPLANLDPAARASMRALLKSVQRQSRCTALHVTHDQDEAMRLADILFVMHNGAIVQAGPPAHVHDLPADRFVASFIGDPPMNFIDGTIDARDGQPRFVESGDNASPGFTLPFDRAQAASLTPLIGRTVVLGIRPHALHLATTHGAHAPTCSTIQLTVDRIEHVGSAIDIHCHTGARSPITARLSRSAGAIAPQALLSVDQSCVMLFEPGPRGKRIWPETRRAERAGIDAAARSLT